MKKCIRCNKEFPGSEIVGFNRNNHCIECFKFGIKDVGKQISKIQNELHDLRLL